MEKKIVILTGANGGIGSNLITHLLKENYQVIAIDLTNSRIKDMDVEFYSCDLTKEDEVRKIYDEISKKHPHVDVIINAVGIFLMESIIEGEIDHFKKIIDVNFFSIYIFNKIFFPLLDKTSRIINITSEVAKYTSQPFEGYYSLSKRFLDEYTDVLRREANYLGIKVIKIRSGNMATPLVKGVNKEYQQMVDNSKYFKSPLTKLKYMMDRELKKSNDPSIISKKIIKVMKKKHPRISYKVKNSFYLALVGNMPESLQDKIYLKVIK